MGFITNLVQSEKWKKTMAYVYGWGASAVLAGALFKIQHWPGAGIMITIGMGTEILIFFMSAFEPLHEEVDWSLVYPQLAGMDGEDVEMINNQGGYASSGSALEKFDALLEEGKLGPDLFKKLGDGLSNLNETTSQLSELSNATVATNEYTKNLEALNAVYEMQINTSKEQLEATKQIYGGVNEMMTSLTESVEGAKQYKEQLSQLGENLQSLNKVYGNMLSAMNVNK